MRAALLLQWQAAGSPLQSSTQLSAETCWVLAPWVCGSFPQLEHGCARRRGGGEKHHYQTAATFAESIYLSLTVGTKTTDETSGGSRTCCYFGTF